MRRALAWLALLAALEIGAAPAAAAPTVVLISWDGTRHDYPTRTSLPGLERMARDGARAARMIPVFPSSTFPCHVSLATGTWPDRHGIVGNRFLDRERGRFDYGADASWIEAEPLWAAAERQGVRAAAYFWVGSETDWRGVGATWRETPFDPGVSESAKVARILEWLDLPGPERPRLVLSWWRGPDRAGHRHGPDSHRVLRDLEAQDRQLQTLLEALDARDAWEETTLLVVSDHGMTALRERVPLREALADAGVEAELSLESAVAHVFLANAEDESAALAALSALPGVVAHRRGALPGSLRIAHPRRTGDLVLVTEPPRTFHEVEGAGSLLTSIAHWFGVETGAHGYAPDHPDMAGIFYALGRGVPAGAELGEVHITDVAPTVTRLLGIEPPAHAEGRPIQELGEELGPGLGD